jgi:DNA-binding Lrp family transcriptional regulator
MVYRVYKRRRSLGVPVMRLATNSLERALVILQLIGKTAGGLTNLEISVELKIARSTCSYILSRLEREAYLVRDKASGKYRIGLKTLILGRGALREVKRPRSRATENPAVNRKQRIMTGTDEFVLGCVLMIGTPQMGALRAESNHLIVSCL